MGGGLGVAVAFGLTAGLDEENRFFTLLILGVGGLLLGGVIGYAVSAIRRGGVTMETEPQAGSKLEGFGTTKAGVAGGFAMIVVSVVWFVGGLLMADRIYFYPPILFIIGMVSVGRGMFGSE